MSVPIEWKAADDGTLEGWASTFGNVDLGADVVTKGAFAATIPDIKANGIPLLADHVASTASVLGTIYDAQETEKGLRIKARFSSAPSAQDVRTKLIEGHLKSLSIGYEATKYSFAEVDGKTVRNIDEAKLWETSVVVFPMNPEATISRVKSLAGAMTPDERKALADALVEDDTTTDEAEPVETTDSTLSSEGDAEAAHVEANPDETDDTPAGGDAPAGWDRYASEAILNGGDPNAVADPARLAGIRTRLELNESALADQLTPRED
ncbi:HK97 family phage prohead protease [Luteipulveratus mongoliensis]|uniref:HK97 family phage prohead protease n=1 Tax=Luteipulveratus mongoliensis TaxID=571913 RepID=UPI0014702748|nr:HK97 family phage prohead protease [Luteipulveratus mongoliensis]